MAECIPKKSISKISEKIPRSSFSINLKFEKGNSKRQSQNQDVLELVWLNINKGIPTVEAICPGLVQSVVKITGETG